VLRTEFAGVEPRRPERPVERILVTFGGGDDRGGIAFAIRALAPALPEGIELVVMTGANNPNIPQIRDLVSKHGFDNINLQVAPPDVPALLVSCDLAVMAGGTSITEAAYCGLPMVLMAIAANQQGQCGGWERLGAARYLGPLETCPSERLSGSVLGLLDDWAARAEMARCGTGNVDLNGAARLLGALLQQD
jgi:spore coat polysaccharide biosynthesis predicted glycosyltransferase SpsG